jgi:hypothetical protein
VASCCEAGDGVADAAIVEGSAMFVAAALVVGVEGAVSLSANETFDG